MRIGNPSRNLALRLKWTSEVSPIVAVVSVAAAALVMERVFDGVGTPGANLEG